MYVPVAVLLSARSRQGLKTIAIAHGKVGDVRASVEKGLQLFEMHKTNPTWFPAGEAPIIAYNLLIDIMQGEWDNKVFCQALAFARRVVAHERTFYAFSSVYLAQKFRLQQGVELSWTLESLAALRAAHLLDESLHM